MDGMQTLTSVNKRGFVAVSAVHQLLLQSIPAGSGLYLKFHENPPITFLSSQKTKAKFRKKLKTMRQRKPWTAKPAFFPAQQSLQLVEFALSGEMYSRWAGSAGLASITTAATGHSGH